MDVRVIHRCTWLTLIFLCGVAATPMSVNINTASADDLAEVLIGVGPVVAKRIVDFRKEHGPFPVIDALVEVRGVGAKTLEKNRARMVAIPLKRRRRAPTIR